jgi:hypothetical protein
VREKTQRGRPLSRDELAAPAPSARRRILNWVVPVAVLTLLGLLAWLTLGSRTVLVYDPVSYPGIDRAVVRWESSQETPTALEYARMDQHEFTRQEAPGTGTSHEVTIRDLVPGCRYRFHVVLPEGRQRSRQFVFETRQPRVVDLRVPQAGAGRFSAEFRTDVPLVTEVLYRTTSGAASAPASRAPTTAHRADLAGYAPSANVELGIRFRTTPDGPAHELRVPAPPP